MSNNTFGHPLRTYMQGPIEVWHSTHPPGGSRPEVDEWWPLTHFGSLQAALDRKSSVGAAFPSGETWWLTRTTIRGAKVWQRWIRVVDFPDLDTPQPKAIINELLMRAASHSSISRRLNELREATPTLSTGWPADFAAERASRREALTNVQEALRLVFPRRTPTIISYTNAHEGKGSRSWCLLDTSHARPPQSWASF